MEEHSERNIQLMKKMAVAIALGAALVLAGCTPGDQAPEQEASALLEAHNLDGLQAVEIIDQLDRVAVAERATNLMASVRSDSLLITDGQEEVTLEIPEDRFYVSIAPYVSQTHDCYYHSLTTCVGELSQQEVDLRITDSAGNVLVDETVTTFDNGFVGVWLPRDVSGTIEIGFDGFRGSASFATTDDGATCITTLQLA